MGDNSMRDRGPDHIRSTFFAAFLGMAGTLFAADPVFYAFQAEQGHYQFEGGFTVKAEPQVIWDVLTDFDHYSSYISNMHCHVRQKDTDGLLVDQTVGGGFLFIQENIHSRLYIQEDPMNALTFTGVDRKAFDAYGGGWRILPLLSDGSVKVMYEVDLQKGKKTPGFLTSDLFSGSQGDLLGEMRREILKRQARLDKDRLKTVKEARKGP